MSECHYEAVAVLLCELLTHFWCVMVAVPSINHVIAQCSVEHSTITATQKALLSSQLHSLYIVLVIVQVWRWIIKWFFSYVKYSVVTGVTTHISNNSWHCHCPCLLTCIELSTHSPSMSMNLTWDLDSPNMQRCHCCLQWHASISESLIWCEAQLNSPNTDMRPMTKMNHSSWDCWLVLHSHYVHIHKCTNVLVVEISYSAS